MKTPRFLPLLAAIIAPAALLVAGGCSKSTSSSASDSMKDAKTSVTNAAVDVKNAAVDTWQSIKDYTYEKRVEFSASMDRMSKTMDDKIADLKSSTSSTTDSTKAAAIKDYDDARADLKAKLNDLSNATADTWAEAKANVKKAWDRVKDAYARATA